MSEDDRAAKAARAKAMLKKRQQKKGGQASAQSVATSSPVSPPELRAFSPAPSEPNTEERRDLSDVFSKDDPADTSWINSLARVGSPPPPSVSSPPPPPSAPQSTSVNEPDPKLAEEINAFQTERASRAAEVKSLEARLQITEGLQDTLKNVRSENASLIEEVKRLQSMESKLKAQTQDMQTQLDSIKSENESLSSELAKLQPLQAQLMQAQEFLKAEQEISMMLNDQIVQLQEEKDELSENSQRTISLLVSEKTSLAADLERLEGFQSKAQEAEESLANERARSQDLEERVKCLQSELQQASGAAADLEVKEKALADKTKEQERQLQLANGSIASLRKDVEKHQRKVRELEEHIQSDNRAERLEVSLKNTQDRADELEFQLSKLKQSHSSVKTERDDLETRLKQHMNSEEEWKTNHSDLSQSYSSVQEELAKTVTEKTTLAQEKSALQTEVDTTQKALSILQEKLTQAASEMASTKKQLQTLQNELTSSNRRADEAERIQKDLQSEGTNLMRSLDEMRPKIVELTGVKLELTEKVEDLERKVRDRDATISELEGNIDQVQDEKEQIEKELKDAVSRHEKEHKLSQSNSTELQKAYEELKNEFDSSQASVKILESERSNYMHEAALRLEEVERVSATSNAQLEQFVTLREELDQRKLEQESVQDVLNRTQNELETLLGDVAAKEEEILRLREAASTHTDAPRTLDDEMLNSVRQQHALELSATQSQIRALEADLFDAEAREHALQKQVSALEDRLLSQRPSSRRSFSPSSRPSSRGATNPPELRRPSLGSHRPSNLSGPVISALDQQLSPETLHKRKVSLSMLKARIDSEAAAAAAHSRPSSRALSPVLSVGTSTPSSHHHHSRRPQFLDDSHVFWCSACSGDLVIL